LFYPFAIVYAIACAILRRIGLLKAPVGRTTRQEAAEIIDSFVNGKDNHGYGFDWFCGTTYFSDPLIQRVARECCDIHLTYPAKGAYCDDRGFARLRQLRDMLLSAKEND
jgi:hypothetical protein